MTQLRDGSDSVEYITLPASGHHFQAIFNTLREQKVSNFINFGSIGKTKPVPKMGKYGEKGEENHFLKFKEKFFFGPPKFWILQIWA